MNKITITFEVPIDTPSEVQLKAREIVCEALDMLYHNNDELLGSLTPGGITAKTVIEDNALIAYMLGEKPGSADESV